MTHEHPDAPVALYITRAHGTSSGGMEKFSYELVQALDENPKIRLRTLTHKGSRLTAPIFVFSVIPRALKAATKADIIYLADPVLSFAGWWIRKFRYKPVAINVHGLDITYNNLLYRLYLRFFFRQFDLYLPISQHVAKLLATKKVSGKITVVKPGVPDNYYRSNINLSQLDNIIGQSTSGKTILLTVGRLVKRKGHAWFITNVLPGLPRSSVYVIAGSGPESLNIRQAAYNAGLQDQVILLSRVDDGALKILYNTAHAFIQPNIEVPNDIEGFGLVVLEAALCERPVFASDLEGLKDSIINGKNGTLITPENSLAWTMALRRFCATKEANPSGQKARQFTLEHFNWTLTSNKYITALTSVTKK